MSLSHNSAAILQKRGWKAGSVSRGGGEEKVGDIVAKGTPGRIANDFNVARIEKTSKVNILMLWIGDLY